MMKHLICVLILGLTLTAPAQADEKDKGWIELTGSRDGSVWKGTVKDWVYAESVEVDAKNPKLLSFKEKQPSDMMVNSAKGKAPDLYTKESFGDVEVHLEFFIPKGSNSGIKFHGVYEIQIHDSYGVKELTGEHCGGIYPRAELKPKYMHIDKGIAPKVNACKEPGQWQTLDITFHAPRFDKDGKKTANARIVKAELNGKVIHENQEMATPTGNNYTKQEVATGPLMLQGDHGPIAFRNVRVRPMK